MTSERNVGQEQEKATSFVRNSTYDPQHSVSFLLSLSCSLVMQHS